MAQVSDLNPDLDWTAVHSDSGSVIMESDSTDTLDVLQVWFHVLSSA